LKNPKIFVDGRLTATIGEDSAEGNSGLPVGKNPADENDEVIGGKNLADTKNKLIVGKNSASTKNEFGKGFDAIQQTWSVNPADEEDYKGRIGYKDS
jgi:hypothetical protein